MNDAEPLSVTHSSTRSRRRWRARQRPIIADGFVEVAQAVVDVQANELPDPSADDFTDAWKGWVKGVGKSLGRKERVFSCRFALR